MARSDREVEARRRLADVAHDLAGEATEEVVASRVIACCAALFAAGRVTMTVHGAEGGDRVWTDDFEDGPNTLARRSSRAAAGAIRVHPLTRTRESYGAHDLRLLEVVAAEAAAGLLNARALATASGARAPSARELRAHPPP